MGAILGTQISQNMFLAMFFTIMYVGRIFGETTIYFMAILWKNGHFGLFWAILGRFEPFVGTQNFWIFVPCFIFPQMTFCQQLSGINIIFHAFFQKVWFSNDEFWAKMGVFEGPIFIGMKNHPENTWNMFIGSIRNPMQKSGDGPFFFLFGPLKLSFSQLGPLTVQQTHASLNIFLNFSNIYIYIYVYIYITVPKK